jgi:transcriptional regulator GlxA family with amidase domain
LRAFADPTEIIGFGIEGPLAREFMREMSLGAGVYPYGPAPMDQVRDLMDSLKDSSRDGRQRASMLAISAIYDIADAVCRNGTPLVIQKARQMIQQEFADPGLTCAVLAAKVGWNRAHFRRMFHRHTGATIAEYRTQVRLGQAQSLIRHSDHKVAEIGRMCGFRGPSYFARWLRKHTGYLPGELRRTACCAH